MSTMQTSPAVLSQGTWVVDPAHSSVGFAISHLGITTVKGHFRDFDGTLEVAADGTIAVAGTVRADSVDTREPHRDDQLRSADVLDVAKYPQITLHSTACEAVEQDTYRITGELTLHGVTREITLGAEAIGTEEDPWGNTRVGLELSGQIDREDFGLTFNQPLASGALLLGRKVKLTLDISAVKQS